MAQGGHLVWPGGPGPGWSCCVGALGPRPQKGFDGGQGGRVGRAAEGASGPTGRGVMRDGRVSWGGVGGPHPSAADVAGAARGMRAVSKERAHMYTGTRGDACLPTRGKTCQFLDKVVDMLVGAQRLAWFCQSRKLWSSAEAVR